jgi:hypothetical protein
MNLSKDVLGLIVLKLEFKDVLNLRASCKHFDKCIRSYNKYWFLRWLIRVYRFKNVFNCQLGKHKGCTCKIGNFSFELPYIQCVCPNHNDHEKRNELLNEIKSNPLYSLWIKEYKESLSEEARNHKCNILCNMNCINIQEGYCKMKYFQVLFPNYICEDLSHYSIEINPEYLVRSYHEIIHDRLIEFYDLKINYFDHYTNFKPEHVRCKSCKQIFEMQKEFCGFHKFNCVGKISKIGIDNHSSTDSYNLEWKDGIPEYLSINDDICDDCILFYTEKGILKYVESTESSDEDFEY